MVDKDGKLVGNLSIRDLKLIGADAAMFWRLQQTVKNFLDKVSHSHITSPTRRAAERRELDHHGSSLSLQYVCLYMCCAGAQRLRSASSRHASQACNLRAGEGHDP